MRNLISVAVILHVAFTVAGLQLNGKEVEFGDLIAYPPKRLLSTKIIYEHYAVFVGNEYPGKGNIFHHSNKPGTVIPGCIFGNIDSSGGHRVFNFLDGYKGNGTIYTKGTETQMKARIEERRANCGAYRPYCNNCEHLATYVRYGRAVSLQFNLTEQNKCDIPQYEDREDMLKFVTGLGQQDNAASSSG